MAVILVTGRILSHLKEDLPEQDLFDGIVAENGAVLALPNEQNRVFGRAPSVDLIAELGRRKIEIRIGESLVEAGAADAPALLEAVRVLKLPLTLHFNRDRVMLLPPGISKATGLRELLRSLRLSLHNCIGIGDAENDFALLEACEIGVAVEWGSKSLHAIADELLAGDPSQAVAEYIRAVTRHTKLPPQRADSRRILLGHTGDRAPLATAVHGRNILIAGHPRSGKSWVTGLFCEQLLLQVTVSASSIRREITRPWRRCPMWWFFRRM